MEQVYIQFVEGGVVTAMQLSAEPLEGWTATNAAEIPNTEAQDGCEVEVRWDGKALHVLQLHQPMPTNEDISALRQEAYERECDSLLIAWMGYTAEGDEAKAESARLAYLRAKAEVRARLPYSEGDK